jgi:hypothetical protein
MSGGIRLLDLITSYEKGNNILSTPGPACPKVGVVNPRNSPDPFCSGLFRVSAGVKTYCHDNLRINPFVRHP